MKITEAVFESHGWDPTAPLRALPPEAIQHLLYATKDEKVVIRYKHERGENSYVATFEGVVTNLERRYRETESEYIKTELEKFMVERPVPGLRREAAAPRGARSDRRRSGHLGCLRPGDHGRACLGGDAQRRASRSVSGRSPTRS